jgi:hypothetical protein
VVPGVIGALAALGTLCTPEEFDALADEGAREEALIGAAGAGGLLDAQPNAKPTPTALTAHNILIHRIVLRPFPS